MGLYSSHMTGAVSTMADRLALGDAVGALVCLGLVAAFIAGAALSTLLANEGLRRGLAGIHALSILAEAVLLAGLAAADAWAPGFGGGFGFVLGMSALMGLQNAVVTRISNARIRTTHVTGMVTDIGIELGNLLDIALRRRRQSETAANLEKLGLHVPTVLAFFLGGVLGVFAYRAIGSGMLLAVALGLAALALPGILATRRPAASAAPPEGRAHPAARRPSG
ncbi:YoaK family protein [Belnapia mucosa]|uniref:YoaK family protein n=1 Tax=Belnapia mucosa TaxID=2804532 RepID=UPI002E2DC4F8|nr:YoaK family protein [Belnapia mucosa]